MRILSYYKFPGVLLAAGELNFFRDNGIVPRTNPSSVLIRERVFARPAVEFRITVKMAERFVVTELASKEPRRVVKAFRRKLHEHNLLTTVSVEVRASAVEVDNFGVKLIGVLIHRHIQRDGELELPHVNLHLNIVFELCSFDTLFLQLGEAFFTVRLKLGKARHVGGQVRNADCDTVGGTAEVSTSTRNSKLVSLLILLVDGATNHQEQADKASFLQVTTIEQPQYATAKLRLRSPPETVPQRTGTFPADK